MTPYTHRATSPERPEPMSTMPAVFSKMIGDKRSLVRSSTSRRTRDELQNYPEGQWISRQRERLNNAIERAAGEDNGNEERTVR